jgi:hypothetical protein
MTATVPKWEIDTENHVGVAVFQGNPNTLGALLPKGYLGVDAADGELWQTTDGAGTWVQLAATGTVSWGSITGKPTTLDGAGLLGGLLTAQTNISGTVAGDYMATIRQASATGYGLFIKPGSDTLGALAINNAANSSQNIILYGSGNATFSGTVTAGVHAGAGTVAAGGVFRLAKSTGLNWRNNANSGDIVGIYTDTSDILHLGNSAVAVLADVSLFAKGVIYAGDAATARTYGDINARRSSTTGVIYFGDDKSGGGSAYLYFDGTNYNFGAWGAAAGVYAQGSFNTGGGQVRAEGWYNGGDTTLAAAEMGYTSGAAYFLGYNRGGAAYIPVVLNGSNVTLQASNTGAVALLTTSAFTYGGIQVATIAWSSSAPTSSTPGIVGTLFGVT